jgi:hypothetical protein
MRTTVPLGQAELTEIGAYVDFATGAPAPVREVLGIDSLRVGSASRSPRTWWHRCAASTASRACPRARS